MNSKDYWNNTYSKQGSDVIINDAWLEEFDDIIDNTEKPIVDLGCGSGGNALYLTSKGKKVICCDYSEVAIENINKNFPNEETLCFDMTEGLPFDDESCDMIVADLSLHYFDDETTKNIISDIKRCLVNGGVLLARLNSINDTNYGANEGKEIENHYFLLDDQRTKRFFDEEDIDYYFKDFKEVKAEEATIGKYGKDKKCFIIEMMKDDYLEENNKEDEIQL